MKALILEDDPLYAEDLKEKIVSLDLNLEVVRIIDSVSRAKDWLSENKESADIIFADIRLKDGLSFDALRLASKNTSIVFTTAYEQYALPAFDFYNISFLLKPIDAQKLKDAIQSTAANVAKDSDKPRMPNSEVNKRIALPLFDGYELVDSRDISGIESREGVTTAYLKNGRRVSLCISLRQIEDSLDKKVFFRLNRQWEVNTLNIKRISKSHLGLSFIVIEPDIKIPLSYDRALAIIKWLRVKN